MRESIQAIHGKKCISDELAEAIQDFAAEYQTLESYVLEKDIFVVEAIRSILSTQEDTFQLVFCGGTCLSKAYNLLERMSEDVDFKIVVKKGLTKSALRRELSHYLKRIESQLIQSFGDGNISKESGNNNRYTEFKVTYASLFPEVDSLRPELKIELTYAEINHPTQFLRFGTLFNQLLLKHRLSLPFPVEEIEIECISLNQALVEKLVSFPRRLAMKLSKTDVNLSSEDNELIRHLYDVHQILAKHPELIENIDELSILLMKVIEKDAEDFKNQYQRFLIDPEGEMLNALSYAKQNEDLRAQYEKFVQDMIYANTIPTFGDALQVFADTLNKLLSK
jgi:predicted nucleotidyltransferase component of viral defense system